jgi:hypothetical protein
MPKRRDNDVERMAIVDRLLDDYRRTSRRQAKAEIGESGSARAGQPERRRYRSDVELREQRADLERQWASRREPRRRKKSS